ncbi:MAG: nitroreductase family protein [Gammaproteobacteria bacterium]|nr:nitroreductase family protein [Gammaproteobacteria bacterium]
MQAARWAPNHHHNEPWHFYLPGPETREAICQLNAEQLAAAKGEAAGQKKLERWRGMPGWLIVTSERAEDPVRDRENYAACCCLVQNLALYLWEHGVGLKWSTGEVVRDPHFFELLGADPAAEQVVGLFWYGYPEDVPRMSRRPATDSLTELP